jgi:hypothetical protein
MKAPAGPTEPIAQNAKLVDLGDSVGGSRMVEIGVRLSAAPTHGLVLPAAAEFIPVAKETLGVPQ